MPLAPNQRRYLRALGHHLNPIVQVGHQGVTDGVLGALDQALTDHELVKVKVAPAVDDREAAAEALAAGTRSDCAQILGRTLLLYRPREEKPKITLPPARVGSSTESD
jgi:RNA-binding protein